MEDRESWRKHPHPACPPGVLGTNWIRDDEAQARLLAGSLFLILELPHALQREAELKAIKDQKARAAVPNF